MAKSKSTEPQKTPPVLRDPTPAEALAVASALKSQTERPVRAALTIKSNEDGVLGISHPHADGPGWWATVHETLGTTSEDFVNDCLARLSNTLQLCNGPKGADVINSSLALIGGIAPENEAQAAIAVQIAIAHATSIHLTGRGLSNANAGHVEAAAALMGMATKASRTMVAHVEALAKLRGGGRQVIEHRYVTVNAENAVVGDRTQAVFGGVSAPGGAKPESEPRPHERDAIAYAPLAPMPSFESSGDALSGASDARKEAVSPPRREVSRRPHGASERAVRPRAAD